MSQRVLAIGLLALMMTSVADAQDAAPSLEERLSDPVFASWISQQKVATCLECHYEASLGARLAGRLTNFSRREELEVWLSNDKHTIARRRVEPIAESEIEGELRTLEGKLEEIAIEKAAQLELDTSQVFLSEFPKEWIGDSNLLSRRICDQLWGKDAVTKPAGYAKFRDHCLTCHGGYQPGQPGFDYEGKADAQIGIDCLYCHQNQEVESKEWETDHYGRDWRLKTPAEKSALGMNHLVGTANQAALCFDCHVGNRAKQMFVTHEMYAAGHPPLPSIELETFSKQMPQHWQTPGQLHKNLAEDASRDEYFAINYPGVGDAGATFWNTRKMLIGALAARKKSLQLLIDSAAKEESWGDFALYDCAACHHELRTDSRRQKRTNPTQADENSAGWRGRYSGPPGRPRQAEWPDSLLFSAVWFAGLDKQVMEFEGRLHWRFGETPFGHRAQVAEDAGKLLAELDAAITKLEQTPLSAQQARQILGVIALTPEEKLLSYDAARQVVWAMRVIAAELESANQPLDPDVAKLIEEMDEPEIDAGG
ncbi:MAG: hypothetical protein MI861_05265, partial [Pirellulales bacterium]|nr:hypothetical protein [Pirellulales bacterium]